MIPENVTLSTYIVACIDVLGQTDELAKLNDFPETNIEWEEYRVVVGNTVGQVRFFRELIELMWNAIKKIPELRKSNPPTKKQKLLSKHYNPKLEVQYVADSAYLKINLLDHSRNPNLGNIDCLLTLISVLVVESLSAGIVLRGGIDLGICSDLKKNDLYGAAMSGAHSMESKIAHFPRIVVSNNVLDYINSIRLDDYEKYEKKVITNILRMISEKIIQDEIDGLNILCFLQGSNQQGNDETKKDYKKTVKRACEYIQEQINNGKHSEKYNYLKQHFKYRKQWQLRGV